MPWIAVEGNCTLDNQSSATSLDDSAFEYAYTTLRQRLGRASKEGTKKSKGGRRLHSLRFSITPSTSAPLDKLFEVGLLRFDSQIVLRVLLSKAQR